MEYRFQFKGLAEILVFLAIYASVTQSKIVPGYLNIDCGRNSTEYEDSQTGLTWENDNKYMQAGMTGVVPQSVDQSFDNHEALGTFRYFPNSQRKQCYHLPVSTGNVSVLIRAMFYHGNSAELDLPISFTVYIGATAWNSIQFTNSGGQVGDVLDIPGQIPDDLTSPLVLEGIFFSPGNVTYFCLLPVLGAPFISSLELRPLDSEGVMYTFTSSRQVLLSKIVRWSCANSTATTLRYPEDSYDRLWTSPPDISTNGLINGSLPANVTTSSRVNNVPLKVMAGFCNGISSRVDFPFKTPGLVCAMVYSVNLTNTNSSGGLVTDFNLNSVPMQSYNFTNQITLEFYPHNVQEINLLDIGVDGLVNAIEVYQEIIFDSSYTTEEDARFIDLLTTTFNITDWQGDPCTPIPYDWITCSQDLGTVEYSIVSISLSNLTNSTRFRDLGSSLTNYTALGLLAGLSITDSHVDDTTFQVLLETMSTILTRPTYEFNSPEFPNFKNLDMSNNDITAFPAPNSFDLFDGLHSINFSRNHLEGEVPSFLVDLTFSFGGPTLLNLSDNYMTAFPKSWGGSAQGYHSLAFLDFSNNKIKGDMSSLDELVQQNSLLEEIYVSNNGPGLSGNFSSELYFSNLSNLRILNLEGNGISRVLNLTLWHEKLKNSLETRNISSFNQLFSFVNNSISDIDPSAKILQPTIEMLINNNESSLFNESGVLIGGNPFCKDKKSDIERYLCRSSTKDIIYGLDENKNYVALIIGLSIGVAFLLAISCILFLSIWKLWKQVSSLRKIQQELVDRKVQPPFYSYGDIKNATRNFHKENELGKGTFGGVYKGVLQDGTVVAVKRLFNSKKLQVLNEFLNEVVLITGIKHKNLVQLTGCCIKETERILVYEYAENGNIADSLWGQQSKPYLDEIQEGKQLQPRLNWKQRLNICVGIARGLSYLHEELQPRIIHRDIKAANVLLDKDWNPKIADFGLAKPILDEETQAQFTFVAGTRGYFAPEYVLEGHLTEKADVFSFGILVLEILSGRKCIDFTLPPDTLYLKTWVESLNEEGKLLDLLEPELRKNCPEDEALKVIDIALSCIQNDPKRRATMSRVVVALSGNIEIVGIADERILGSDPLLKKMFAGKHLEFEESTPLSSEIDEQSSFFSRSRADTEGSPSSASMLSSYFSRKSSKGKRYSTE